MKVMWQWESVILDSPCNHYNVSCEEIKQVLCSLFIPGFPLKPFPFSKSSQGGALFELRFSIVRQVLVSPQHSWCVLMVLLTLHSRSRGFTFKSVNNERILRTTVLDQRWANSVWYSNTELFADLCVGCNFIAKRIDWGRKAMRVAKQSTICRYNTPICKKYI